MNRRQSPKRIVITAVKALVGRIFFKLKRTPKDGVPERRKRDRNLPALHKPPKQQVRRGRLSTRIANNDASPALSEYE
jgi:hypothetical protein